MCRSRPAYGVVVDFVIKEGGCMSWALASHAHKMQRLIDLVRLSPAVRSCIQRIVSEVLPPSVEVLEQGKPLKPELQRVIGPWLSDFLSHSIEMAFMCGFVVFVRRRHEGVSVPVLLPLGSFTWGVEMVTQKTKKRKRDEGSLYRYSVRPIHAEVTEDDLFVFNFYQPALYGEYCLPSPLDRLCELRAVIDISEQKLARVLEWNSTKHITTTERVAIPKDATTEGISLLDDFRRYLVSGKHLGLSKNLMTLNGPRAAFVQNPSTLSSQLIRKQFEDPAAGDTVKTDVHVLPPNTDVSELAPLDLKTGMLELQDVMNRQVAEFFHMPMLADLNSNEPGAAMQRNELKHMRQMTHFCTALGRFAYACVFDVPEKNVQVELQEPSGMHIQSADDVKKLHESQTLLPSDRLKLRKRFMQNT